MTTTRTLLDAIHHISEHSIFFRPAAQTSLDLRTLSAAPPCHRAALQRNGLIAKVYAAVSFTNDTENDGGEPVISVAGAGTNEDSELAALKKDALSTSGRQDLWRSALTYAGLLRDKDAALRLPDHLCAMPWPCLTDSQFRCVVRHATARAACAAVNTSAFCVPILSLQEYVYQRPGVQLSLAVLWMPYYPLSLRQWAASWEKAGQTITESLLLTLLHHVTAAQLTVRSGSAIAERSEAIAAVSAPHLDSVVVFEGEGDRESRTAAAAAGEGKDAPLFLLCASASEEHAAKGEDDNTEGDCHAGGVRRGSSAAHTSALQLQRALHRAPEVCAPHLHPSTVAGTAKRAVWAMGVLVYLLAAGRVSPPLPATDGGPKASPSPQSPRRMRVVEEVPFNATAMTPDAVWKRLRRDLERRGYTGTLVSLTAQLLSLDPLTRPSLTTLDRTLQDLHRPTPIHRFPFVLGDYDLLRLPNAAEAVSLNPGARRYAFTGLCVLCKKSRSSTAVCSKGGDHQTAGTTSPSWSDEGELLPNVAAASESTYMTFLHPLCAAAGARQRRKNAARALQSAHASMSLMASCNTTHDVAPLDCTLLFQVFGGFAVYERRQETNPKRQVGHAVMVREVLIPYPTQGLRRSERQLAKTTLHFSAALPWPSCCTETLQRGGRVSRNVPFALVGAHHDVEWFGWVLPGERFALPNGSHWTAPLDGAFVFWFSPDLQPTDRDRYYALTGARSATLPARVSRTLLPDSLFRQRLGDESQASTLLHRSVTSGNFESVAGQSVRSPAASAARRRSTQSVTDVHLPCATHEIVEEEAAGGKGNRLMNATADGASGTGDGGCGGGEESPAASPRSGRRRRSSATRPRRSLSCHVAVVAAAGASTAAAAVRERVKEADAGSRGGSEEKIATSAAPPARDDGRSPQQLQQTPQPLSSASPPPTYPTPTSCGPSAPREGTQPPSHRDTSARNVRALAPLAINAEGLRSPREYTAREGKKTRKSRVMMAAEAPRMVAVATEQPKHTPTPLPQEVDACRLPSKGSAATGVATQALSSHNAHRPTSSQGSGLHSGRQPYGELATPTYATPKLAPLSFNGSSNVAALASLQLIGRWLPADSVDAAFKGLTFWVFATGEHGDMHPPVRLSPHMSYALRTPPASAFVAFLSNQVPLFRRNHPRMDVAVFSQSLPHHGFACYAADGQLLGVLSLRCSTVSDAAAAHGEFRIDTHVRDACHGTQVSARGIYASYLSNSVGDEAAMLLRARASSDVGQAAQLCHTPSCTQAGMDSRNLWNSPSEAQTLTFTSARRLVGEFTPHEHENDEHDTNAAASNVLPACWMGFDGASGLLLFADVAQSVWVPYGIGG